MSCYTNCSILKQNSCELKPSINFTLASTEVDGVLGVHVQDLANISSGSNFSDLLCSAYSMDPDSEQMVAFSQISTQMSVAVCVMAIFGTTANFFALNLGEKDEFLDVLTALLLSDSGFSIFTAMEVIKLKSSFFPDFLMDYFPTFIYPLQRVFQTFSLYLRQLEILLLLSLPDSAKKLVEKRKLMIFLLLFLALFLNIGKFMETKVAELCWDFRSCECGLHKQKYLQHNNIWKNNFYLWYAGWPCLILTCLLPLCFLFGVAVCHIFRWNVINKTQRNSLEIELLSVGGPATVQRNANERMRTRSHSQLVSSSVSPDGGRLFIPTTWGIQQRRGIARVEILGRLFLISTLLFQMPRVIGSVYEAANLGEILHCLERGVDITPLPVLYIVNISQLLQVTCACLNLCWILACRSDALCDWFLDRHQGQVY